MEQMLPTVFPDVKIVVSSANKAVSEGNVVAAGRSLMYIENRKGPRTEPCETPKLIGRYDETVPFIVTAWTLLER